jgi:hypothetical protein
MIQYGSSLFIIKKHDIKTMGHGGRAPQIFNFSIRRRQMDSFILCLIYLQGKDSTTGWLELRANLDKEMTRKISALVGV